MRVDYVIVGAGILGLSFAKTLKVREPTAKIAIIEKEKRIGLHASGRNSGILHAGIYYPSETLKAKFCLQGARAMAAYCDEHQLPIHRIGKIIVPKVASDAATLELLYQRAQQNGSSVRMIDQQELTQLEPEAYSATGQALFSPETAVVDPQAILAHLYQSLEKQGVTFHFQSPCHAVNPSQRVLKAGQMQIEYGHLYNTAGLYADQVAKACGVTDRYLLIPFKGMYYELSSASTLTLNHLIYPVPDLNVPFLGVHVTKSVHGKVYFGPTAIPVLGREHYTGFKGIRLPEALQTIRQLAGHYLNNKQGFRVYTHQEIPRFIKSCFVQSARALVPRLQSTDLLRSTKVGIRAQLFDKVKKELPMDFLVTSTKHETHVLNAVSPAFTSAFRFAEHVVLGE